MGHTLEVSRSKDLANFQKVLDDGLVNNHGGGKNNHKISVLKLSLTDASILDLDFNDLLWAVLSHPNSTVNELEINARDSDVDVLADMNVMKIVKKWCRDVPANSSRKISFEYESWGRDYETIPAILVDLRQALTCQGNRVTELSLLGIPSTFHLMEVLVRPVLEDPNNELMGLHFGERTEFDDDDALHLSKGFASPYCKLETFEIDLDFTGFDTALSIFEGLRAVRCLARLAFSAFDWTLEEEQNSKLMRRLAWLVKRPGNQLRELKLSDLHFEQCDVAILAHALSDEHCRLVELVCEHVLYEEDAALPLFSVIGRPDIALRKLSGNFCGEASFAILGKSLKRANCQLESLTTGGTGGYHGSMDNGLMANIAAALLESASCSRLRQLHVGQQFADVLSAFAISLRSQNNKLTELSVSGVIDLDEADLSDFYRALRVSNVVRARLVGDYGPFMKAFNQPFLQVLYALLSVRIVPRLGHSTWLRLLPVQDLILRIAKTLGWPLDDLRV